MTPAEIVRTVRNFIRWHARRFDTLGEPHKAIADPLGWRRGGEFWLPSPTWHEIFENDEMRPHCSAGVAG
jgi:hypothetical protein